MVNGGWYCEDNLEGSGYNLPRRWVSSMSQGFGLSVMIEAHELTNDKKYLNIAEKVLNSFKVSVVDGGVQSVFGTTVWYDKYPTSPQKHILNGFIFALAGLYDYYKFTKNEKDKILFINGIKALKVHISSFDAGFNSYYSWSENPKIHTIASVTGNKYHHLHIAQLLWVYEVTRDIYFKHWAEKFIQQDFGDVLIYGLRKKIKKIEATHSIDSKTHVVDKLVDSICSYGKYLGTNKFPTELNIEFNRLVQNLKEIIVVTTTETNFMDKDIEIHVSLEDGKDINVPFKFIDRQIYKERHFVSNVQRIGLSSLNIKDKNIKCIKIVFKSYPEKVLAIREINFHYDMMEEIDELLEKFNYEG
jgi:heparosan-N-sulfate-glucuronate 5-epimerase